MDTKNSDSLEDVKKSETPSEENSDVEEDIGLKLQGEGRGDLPVSEDSIYLEKIKLVFGKLRLWRRILYFIYHSLDSLIVCFEIFTLISVEILQSTLIRGKLIIS